MCLEELAVPGEKRDHEKFLLWELRMEYSSFCKLLQTGWKLVITVKPVLRSALHLYQVPPCQWWLYLLLSFQGEYLFNAKQSIFMGICLEFKFRIRLFTIRTVYWPKLDSINNQKISQCNSFRLINTRSNRPWFSRTPSVGLRLTQKEVGDEILLEKFVWAPGA